MKRVLELLGIEAAEYCESDDPVRLTQSMLRECNKSVAQEDGHSDDLRSSGSEDFEPIEWTIPEEWVKDKQLEEKAKKKKVIKNKRQTKSAQEGDELSDSKKAKVSDHCVDTDERSGLIDIKDNKCKTEKTKDGFTDDLPQKYEDTKSFSETVYGGQKPLDYVSCENMLPLEEIGDIKEESSLLTEKTFVVGTQNNPEKVCA